MGNINVLYQQTAPVYSHYLEGVDLVSLLDQLLVQHPSVICEYSKKTTGFWDKRWSCKRKKYKDDLCKLPSLNEQDCLAWLTENLDISNSAAIQLLHEMSEMGLIKVYRCSAVFIL